MSTLALLFKLQTVVYIRLQLAGICLRWLAAHLDLVDTLAGLPNHLAEGLCQIYCAHLATLLSPLESMHLDRLGLLSRSFESQFLSHLCLSGCAFFNDSNGESVLILAVELLPRLAGLRRLAVARCALDDHHPLLRAAAALSRYYTQNEKVFGCDRKYFEVLL